MAWKRILLPVCCGLALAPALLQAEPPAAGGAAGAGGDDEPSTGAGGAAQTDADAVGAGEAQPVGAGGAGTIWGGGGFAIGGRDGQTGVGGGAPPESAADGAIEPEAEVPAPDWDALFEAAAANCALVTHFKGKARGCKQIMEPNGMELPPRAAALLDDLVEQAREAWPELTMRSMLAAQIEQESCVSLRHRRCWHPRAELKTDREYGFGLGQLTVAYYESGAVRFNKWAEMRHMDEKLSSWRWSDRFNAALQLRSIVILNRNNYHAIQFDTANEVERLAFTLSAYNGGLAALIKDRQLCLGKKGCDPTRWFGHVARYSFKSRTIHPGYVKSFFEINREYPVKILFSRRAKYAPLTDPVPGYAADAPTPPDDESLADYLHAEAELADGGWGEAPADRLPIPARRAAAHAVARLQGHGVEQIQICRTAWIAAPVTGYLVDAKGTLELDGETFSTFRIGVRDGYEEKEGERLAGEEFILIARGVDPEGEVHWHPAPGPDFEPAEGETTPESVSVYDYLGTATYRKRFEELAAEFD